MRGNSNEPKNKNGVFDYAHWIRGAFKRNLPREMLRLLKRRPCSAPSKFSCKTYAFLCKTYAFYAKHMRFYVKAMRFMQKLYVLCKNYAFL